MTEPPPAPPPPPVRHPGLLARARGNFLTGLVVVLPIGLTIYVVYVVTGWIDAWVLPFVPHAWRPDTLIQRYLGEDTSIGLRGFGLVFFLIFTTFIGWLAKGFIGRSFLGWTERSVERLPVVRSLYTGLKQIAETVFATGKPTFDRACLVEFPRKDMWSLGFLAGEARGELGLRLSGGVRHLAVYVPTTPNPTSGYVVFVPEPEVMVLDMSIEDAAKLVISAGLVYPPERPTTAPPPAVMPPAVPPAAAR